MLGRILVSAAAAFGALCLVNGSELAENAIVKELLSWNLIGTKIPFAVVVAFFCDLQIDIRFHPQKKMLGSVQKNIEKSPRKNGHSSPMKICRGDKKLPLNDGQTTAYCYFCPKSAKTPKIRLF